MRDFLHDHAFEGQHNALGRQLKPDLLIIDGPGAPGAVGKAGTRLERIGDRPNTRRANRSPLELRAKTGRSTESLRSPRISCNFLGVRIYRRHYF